MLISEGETFVREFARNAGSTLTYSHLAVHRAMRWALNLTRRGTCLTRTMATATLSAATSTFSVAATEFRAEYLIRAWFAIESTTKGGEVEVVDHGSILELQRQAGGTASVQDCPTHVGFYGHTLAETFGCTDTGRSLFIDFKGPISTGTWNLGTAGQTGTLTPSDSYMEDILIGACGYLVRSDPDNQAVALEQMGEFKQFLRDNMGAGNLGAKSSITFAEED